VVAALSAGTAAAARLAEIYALRRPLEQHEVESASVLIEEAGGRAWTRRQVSLRMELALDLIGRLDLDPRAQRRSGALRHRAGGPGQLTAHTMGNNITAALTSMVTSQACPSGSAPPGRPHASARRGSRQANTSANTHA